MTRILPALLIALAGCGGTVPVQTRSAPREPAGSVDDYAQRVQRMQDELAASLGDGDFEDDLVQGDLVRPDGESLMQASEPASAPSPRSVPDCSAAADLRDRICELAERICAIAARDPGDAGLGARCDSARSACERAREDVDATCDDV